MPYADKKDKKAHDKKYGKKTKSLRVLRNKARRKALREGRASKGDDTHVDHKVPLSKGGGNGDGNTRVVKAETNMKKYNKTTGTA
ncbi:MAG: hypothetical protein Unbinned80contig1000_44 [Prokaryotic dsDNA virus sp.]|nr:MAG: hypothetical protein Unbinned80contig1000_44 [Prokaryotic dsDNA virus sp.]|tara:strand:+ start:7720 stop:7974 length:255 start_codon:yes stop_codon:yes gene_type:complete